MARGGMDPERRRLAAHWLPLAVLLAVAVVGLGGWLLFPRLAAYMQRQDCIATGHLNCGG